MEVKITQGFLDSMDRLFDWRWAPYRWGKWVLDIPRELKWKWQRMNRGWADCDTWNANYYIAEVLAGMLGHLKKHHVGMPMEFCGEMKMREDGTWYHTIPDDESSAAWEACLQEMIDGFKMQNAMNDLDNPNFDDPVDRKAWSNKLIEMQDKQDRGLYLFAKHFGNLWD